MAAAVSNHPHVDLLNKALEKANEQLSEQTVIAYFSEPENGKSPAFLSLITQKDYPTPIGAVHVVHLIGENWDEIPFDQLKKAVPKVAQAILKAVKINEEVKDRQDVLLTKRGVPLIIGENDIRIDDQGYLVIDGEIVTIRKNDKIIKILAEKIVSEGKCHFIKLDNGHYEITDSDKRSGKGMFINLEKVIIRA